jgi:glutamate racemase
VVATVQEACPMWVPIVENNEIGTEGAEFFIQRHILNILAKDSEMDTLVLGCTHYPLLIETIKKYVPPHIKIVEQGEITAGKLVEYLNRHPEIETRLSKNSWLEFQTTESSASFESKAALFLGNKVKAVHVRY